MSTRYTLRDRQIFQWIMQHPGRGTPYTVRSLAEAAGIKHHSLVGHLISGRQRTAEAQDAHALTEALGVAVLVLFAPPASPNSTNPNHAQFVNQKEEGP